MSVPKVVTKSVDMPEKMQKDAIHFATYAVGQYKLEVEVAAYIKKSFDKKYSPAWHCIVGRTFGSFVTHEIRNFIYMQVDQICILLFKCGVKI